MIEAPLPLAFLAASVTLCLDLGRKPRHPEFQADREQAR